MACRLSAGVVPLVVTQANKRMAQNDTRHELLTSFIITPPKKLRIGIQD
jgi:hypothetical protein